MTGTRTALVTGASSGIGAAVAKTLVGRGYRVFGTSRNPASIGDPIPGVEYLALDLTDPASIESCAAAAGEVDVLVNNAGESQSGPIEELPMEAVERLFQTNVFGAVRLTQLVLPGMRARGYGRVVMVGSMLASFPLAYRSSYVATKAAIKGFATAARREVAPYGVGVTTVEPGSISTGIGERRTHYLDEGSPYTAEYRTMIAALDANERAGISGQKVAETVVKAIEADRPKQLYAVGSNAPVTFALRRMLPRTMVEKLVARRHGLR
ncbi:short-subunit dehydrogenase [Rhodococcus sp. PvR044]|uniref:SDR family oxidoreductase n=1 Tax=Rhodococcus TaxID=1827 RepID=UPI000BC9EF12|nr:MULTISPECIES: SDR family oxidoreductase [Rhodococcus]MBP1161875.1 short-subunit dehydrogenase [Rhodococcus sp. PvR099]MCZ4555501.1 SDR family oxidoreductase [Rhodococcus maanshanensis]PTR37226.1 short-subunit dehydrogenase [Rhodococcus sp. OK611]SNX93559.1 Short-chain dehydrogenase [Rhodococcus sp. OK270]